MNKMNRINQILVLPCVVLGMLVIGCGDIQEIEYVENVNGEPAFKNSAVVTPEFQIVGLEEIPEELLLERLNLAISEVRLAPLDSDDGSIAYSTSQPFELAFDLSNDEHSQIRDAVEFPETGRFLVSVRLEPQTDSADPLSGSLGIEGKIRSDYLVSGGQREEGDRNDGSPVPLPLIRLQDQEKNGMWTPFRFSSQRAVYYTFTEVELVSGEQVLTFSFDLNDWAITAVRPLIDAVERRESVDTIERHQPGDVIDVSHDEMVDSSIFAPEALLDVGSVSTAPNF